MAGIKCQMQVINDDRAGFSCSSCHRPQVGDHAAIIPISTEVLPGKYKPILQVNKIQVIIYTVTCTKNLSVLSTPKNLLLSRLYLYTSLTPVLQFTWELWYHQTLSLNFTTCQLFNLFFNSLRVCIMENLYYEDYIENECYIV